MECALLPAGREVEFSQGSGEAGDRAGGGGGITGRRRGELDL